MTKIEHMSTVSNKEKNKEVIVDPNICDVTNIVSFEYLSNEKVFISCRSCCQTQKKPLCVSTRKV